MFDGNQKEIGRGVQATVYYYNGFAYKVYDNNYPKQWIHHELVTQEEINKMDLPTVKYYKTEEPNITKMDFIDGITLAKRMRLKKYKNGVEDLIKLQKEVISITNVKLPAFKSFAVNNINMMQTENEKKEKALKFLEEIEEKNNLLHLDLHFDNVMYTDEKYYIIDWINARLGNPIYDYARSYVIMNEFAYRLSKKYKTLIIKDKEIDTTDFIKATYVMALLRLKENISQRTIELIQNLESELIENI